MPPTTPLTVDEDDFMNSLLSGLGSSIHAESSKHQPQSQHIKSPVKISQNKRRLSDTSHPRKRHCDTPPDLDVVALLDGAENWDWKEMEVGFLTPKKVQEYDLAGLLDGAEDWDWEDMEADFLTPKKHSSTAQKPSIPPGKAYARETCTRCTVESVSSDSSDNAFQKVLSVRVHRGEHRSVILRDDWANSDIRAGDIINVLGEFDLFSKVITVSSQSNLLIHHPDLLLTATALSNAPQCRRKPLLSALVRSTSDVTPAIVWGNMLHEVMQSCMISQRWDERWIDERIDEVVRRSLAELVKIGLGVDEAKREVKTRSKGLRVFSERYMADVPKPDAILTNTRAAYGQTSLLAISELHDVEEDIWSPTYGLKGKLDATVQAVIAQSTIEKQLKHQSLLSEHVMPFEIKTGRSVAGMEHRAQTMLYTLLASERYGVEVPSGLLYYTQSEEVVQVPRGKNELRALIGARNEMAAYMMRRSTTAKDIEGSDVEPFLPPTIDDERTCKKCYALDACMLYRKAVEDVQDDSSPIADTYALKTSHLTPAQAAFFKQWESLISLEEQDLVRFKKELWTMNAQEREEKGRCFSSMAIDLSYRAGNKQLPEKIHRYTYRFIRVLDVGATGDTARSLLNGHMSCGDAITVSVEPELLALARGFIVELTPHEVILGVDHEISAGKIAARLRTLRGAAAPVIFRIDKDELFGGMGRIRDNLAQLFYADGDTRRLELVVDLRQPRFDDKTETQDYLQLIPEYVGASASLNSSQLGAMTRVLSAQDYALILGMPGTGKTTVIAALIRTLVGMGRSVLLTSYTHSAVDTILLKLKDVDFGVLRLGNVDKVHPDVRKFTLADRKTAATIEQLENQIMTPPVVRNLAARKGGLETSLFRRLSDAHPGAVVDLTYQYRMNEDIMELSNKLIYGGRLRCGSDTVAKRCLVLPSRTFVESLRSGACICRHGECWLEQILSESCKVVFIDTDLLPAHESRVGDLVQNDIEASLVYQLVEALLRSDVRQDQIGVMSPYRQQIKLLSHLLQDRRQIEILTADRSQGRDKDCIIISMVRSNDSGQIGDLIKDWRRINVSFTRARSKLVIIGSQTTLSLTPLLTEFFTLVEDRKWILKLASGTESMHEIVESPRSGIRSPGKRDVKSAGLGRSQDSEEHKRQTARTPRIDEGLLRGRPVLNDIVNGEK
ncbi:Dna2-domain-containing protein [Leucogyrophana mollusca]|uniref:Dna2-domain-containing protein n=1 Tax=Leucogyrophana mollusca TaxID=85980 RepID=A0ACB8BVK2_9AGAM|nr:Dna2-domain-containing protein [Leucogyrophana mollusca]